MPSLLSKLNPLAFGAFSFLCLSFSAPAEAIASESFTDDILKCKRMMRVTNEDLRGAKHSAYRESVRVDCFQMAIWRECLSTNWDSGSPITAEKTYCDLSHQSLSSELLNGVMFRRESAVATGAGGMTRLSLANCGISNLSGLRFPNTVEEIDLSDNRITDTDLKAMNWTVLPQLKLLDLSHNRITNLSDVLFPNLIESLDLSLNFIVDLGGRSLMRLQRLKSVILSHNSVLDVVFDARFFAQLPDRLWFSLCRNPIDDLEHYKECVRGIDILKVRRGEAVEREQLAAAESADRADFAELVAESKPMIVAVETEGTPVTPNAERLVTRVQVEGAAKKKQRKKMKKKLI